MARLVVPDDQETAIGDEGGELMLLASWEVRDVRKDLETKTVLEGNVGALVVVEEELDDTGVDSHGDLVLMSVLETDKIIMLKNIP